MQRPSWAANWFAAGQKIPRISRNPNVHYRTHKRPPPVSILGQPNPVHIPITHLLEIHPNIIHLSTPRSPHWSLSLRFPQQDPIHPPLLTHRRHMPSPTFFLFLKCLLTSRLTLFRLSKLLWLGSCIHCILANFLGPKNLNILHQTRVYSALIHADPDSLSLRFYAGS